MTQLKKTDYPLYQKTIHFFLWGCVQFANFFLRHLFKKNPVKNSVLHISYMVHIPYETTRILRNLGYKADYLAIGDDPHWKKSDYQFIRKQPWYLNILREFYYFWKIVASYEIIHSHFMVFLSYSGWEIPLLKKMGRKIVIHYRGCEIRDWEKNQQLHPQVNICQQCDYNRTLCSSSFILKRRNLVNKYGDLFFVTTPDLKDFAVDAIHLPFFSPLVSKIEKTKSKSKFKIVHATNHPGIEGTQFILDAIQNLKTKGFEIEFKYLKNVSHDEILTELSDASLSIGKLKMGYYANFQVESMSMGVPALTWMRPEFVTQEIKDSGLIITHLNQLEETISYYYNNPDKLLDKQKKALNSVLILHNNEAIGQKIISYYNQILKQ